MTTTMPTNDGPLPGDIIKFDRNHYIPTWRGPDDDVFDSWLSGAGGQLWAVAHVRSRIGTIDEGCRALVVSVVLLRRRWLMLLCNNGQVAWICEWKKFLVSNVEGR